MLGMELHFTAPTNKEITKHLQKPLGRYLSNQPLNGKRENKNKCITT